MLCNVVSSKADQASMRGRISSSTFGVTVVDAEPELPEPANLTAGDEELDGNSNVFPTLECLPIIFRL